MSNPYEDREQTKAKHDLFQSYLQALAFKVLSSWDTLTYVDGFSGPWKSKTEDFSDTSFMIAVHVLKDAQRHYREQGQPKTIKCFFVEKVPSVYAQMEAAVVVHHDPANGFHVDTFGGLFEDAVPKIMDFIGQSFALVFIDPTGWTGYPYDKIGPVLQHKPGEVLITMMYDYINRFTGDHRPKIEASFDPILGGPGWKERLDPILPTGEAVVKLFREKLKEAGGFKYVTATGIDKVTADRLHYFIAYGTRSPTGLRVFREAEWKALQAYDYTRKATRIDRKVNQSGQGFLFEARDLSGDSDVAAIVEENKKLAKAELVDDIKKHTGHPVPFHAVCTEILHDFTLRETNVKDICVELAADDVIEATWKADGKRKPHDHHMIVLKIE